MNSPTLLRKTSSSPIKLEQIVAVKRANIKRKTFILETILRPNLLQIKIVEILKKPPEERADSDIDTLACQYQKLQFFSKLNLK